MFENRFYKVNQDGGSYVVGLFVNPITWETKTETLRDYDYSDCRNDNDELYYMPIDYEVKEAYRKHLALTSGNDGGYFAAPGDVVEVFKGRKIPVGTIAKIERIFDYKDCYGRVVTTYAVFEDGRKTSVGNLRVIG